MNQPWFEAYEAAADRDDGEWHFETFRIDGQELRVRIKTSPPRTQAIEVRIKKVPVEARTIRLTVRRPGEA
jgi:hypothetical protein